MKRNWNAIRGITCSATRTALAFCSDEHFLRRLQKGFPECFEEGEETVIGVWRDLLVTATEYFIQQRYKDAYNTQRLYLNWLQRTPDGCLEFGINEEVHCNRDFYKDGPIPREILDQFQMIQKLDGPVILQYLGKEWVLGNLWVNGEADSLEFVRAAGDPATTGDVALTIVPKERIVFDL
ncbi:MAG: hypothetical protein A3C02_04460 [Candidatus Andersenbacteria bacterium RIFCSPHIGHO2_02_FULL_45_11]|nr:MAG: hypothetical protein A2805_02820 [Candidatus Andersenbacteria bacterium RIFCSPHIGHO2_01_FULL_46_36]OGY32162.1 MAG: hypothetical protein A3C02_04460 [Candidatus Andersenbacteria bacterium RIFCSPHIGHO2_02_FULL_45_11]